VAKLGDNIRAERARRGWTLKDLADRSGVSLDTLSRIERHEDCRVSTVHKVARALGVPTRSLIPEQTDYTPGDESPGTDRPADSLAAEQRHGSEDSAPTKGPLARSA
jgi:transcriptional regulator with XRE-family HTH domain